MSMIATDQHGYRTLTADNRARIGEPPVTLVSILAAALRRRRVLLLVPFFTALATVTLVLVLPRKYSAGFSFVPQVGASSALSGAASIAAQMGIAVPGVDLTQSPAFYADLLQSDAVARTLAASPYRLVEGSDTLYASMVTVLDIDKGSHQRDLVEAAEKLMEKVKVTSDIRTGIVRFNVTLKNPQLSYQIADRAVRFIADFNNITRQTQASAERRFLEGRMAEVRGELTAAEDNVQKFLINNRDFKDSPVLDLEHDRLQREVAVLQDVYTAVRNQYEQARQSEVRNTPEITLVESPIFPARPDRRHLLVKGLLALLAGVWLAIITIASLEFMDRRRRENSAEVQDLEELARASMVDARRIGSVFRWRRKKTA